MKPREHGAWALLYGPVAIPALAYAGFDLRLPLLLTVMTALFLAEAPLAKLVRTRRVPAVPAQRRRWRKWLAVQAAIALIGGSILLWRYDLQLLPLVGGTMLFFLLLHLRFVSSRQERTLGNQLSAVVALSVGALVGRYVLTGLLDGTAVLLWVISMLFFSSGIFYVRMRISLAGGKPDGDLRRRQSALYHGALAGACLLLAASRLVPLAALIAFVPVLIRAFRIPDPQIRPSPRRLGFTEVAYTLVFILATGFSLRYEL